ncbi:hypothetical protein HC028_17245 [Planosporangium flavigriseum]|uniref:S-adenosyl-L-homocysteine hydrolase NAD binding domain-containing protein n=1 Tax=Planosporangium flavigriseum TaxID=373681 RepID=A0A8J3LK46_9ACTN|nr:NAD(P)-dependent oxidoreductase [Planosporangium flavigriseum]NJC66236.1 hypothetical protein [Planosporangium flavigriseum]GIG74693.1 hypothetical protein Pfl04_30970 [Planosporangium flavigriseum]
MITATAPVIDRHRTGTPSVATVTVGADPADRPDLVAQVVDAIAAIVGVTGKVGSGSDLRLTLDGGAVVRVSVTAPARPEAYPSPSSVVSVVIDDPGRLTDGRLCEVAAAVGRIGFTDGELRQLRAQLPLTATMPAYLPARCLAGIAPVLTVHHMTDFLVMVEAIQAMGVLPEALTVIDKGYRYRHTHRVDAHLRRAGIAVWPWTATAAALDDHTRRARALGRAGLLVDDGGYTLPVLLTQRPDLAGAFVGLVEQTISGITRLAPFAGAIPVPVFSVAESRLKATIESYGVADAAVRNILALTPHEKFEGQAALVLGFGRIGEQIAEVLRTRRMRVAVYDSAIVRLVAAHERGFTTARSLVELLRRHRPLLIVGSTGRTSLRGEHAAALDQDCYLVSTTSRTAEFALDELVEEARSVTDAGVLGVRLQLPHGPVATVVGDGYPINFHYAESMPNKYADLVLASLLVGVATLAHPTRSGLVAGHNVARTDEILESCGLLERYYARFGPSW